MSNSLREVKMRMNATEKTAQITKAMNMVSASKLRRSQDKYLQYKDYMNGLDNVLTNIVSSGESFNHPMLIARPIKKTGYILITSDRGLAGPNNSNVLKRFLNEIKGMPQEQYVCGVIGNQGFNYCKHRGINLFKDESTYVRDDVSFIDIADFAKELIDMYQVGKIDRLVVVYNHFINTISQEVTVKQLLPIEKVERKDNLVINYEFDQGKEKSLDLILPMYVENMLYGFLLDAKTSEHASRMTAMKSATDNALGVIDTLKLAYNRSRQAAITRELIDIVGGANAVS